jgi:hypothetical protein
MLDRGDDLVAPGETPLQERLQQNGPHLAATDDGNLLWPAHAGMAGFNCCR